jgi:hypothetical protein
VLSFLRVLFFLCVLWSRVLFFLRILRSRLPARRSIVRELHHRW